MKKRKTLGFIGAGRITYILLEGLHKAGQLPAEVCVSDVDEHAVKKLVRRLPYPQIKSGSNATVAAKDIVFIGVHPPAISDVLSQIQPSLRSETILVSLAPKFTIEDLSKLLNGFERIVRLIPNAPSIIGSGFNPIVFANHFSETEKSELISLFTAWGKCPEVIEKDLEKYVLLTAVGPTYFWFQWIELCNILESLGLSSEDTHQGLKEMIYGANKTLFESGLSADTVMDLVKIKPLKKNEHELRVTYRQALTSLFDKLSTQSTHHS